MAQDIQVNRKELKYYISYNEYIVLSRLLKRIFQKDKYNQESLGGYLVRSLYFDTLDNNSFEDKVGAIEERSKFRLRIYDAASKSVKFEIKSKTDYTVTKETAIISRDDAEEIQKGNYEVMLKYKNKVLNKAYIEFRKRPYYPVVLVDYLREAFFYDANKIRVVFDRFLKSTPLHLDLFADDIMMPQLKNDIVIMEIKYDNFIPMWIKQLLQIPSFERSAISKYVIGRLAAFGAAI